MDFRWQDGRQIQELSGARLLDLRMAPRDLGAVLHFMIAGHCLRALVKAVHDITPHRDKLVIDIPARIDLGRNLHGRDHRARRVRPFDRRLRTHHFGGRFVVGVDVGLGPPDSTRYNRLGLSFDHRHPEHGASLCLAVVGPTIRSIGICRNFDGGLASLCIAARAFLYR